MSAYKFSFEKLEVWQLSRVLVIDIYKLMEQFPEKEKYGLVSQMKRVAVSVSSNIAEGSTRHSAKDQARFSTIAYGSLIELLNQLILSFDLQLILENQLLALRNKIQALSVKLNNLRTTQINCINSKPKNQMN